MGTSTRFPLAGDAASAAANDVLIRIVAGELSLDDGFDTLRRLSDKLIAGGEIWVDLDVLRNLAISLDLDGDEDLDFDMDDVHPT